MKIIFFGSSDYCLPILEALNNNLQLSAVVTKPKQTVEKFAKSHNIKVFTPKDKKELLLLKDELSSLKPDIAIVADYGLIIPTEIFNIPRYKTLNIHFSKLPHHRGPSPIQYTILAGEKSAWISIIVMDQEMDTGDVLWQKEIELRGDETSESLYTKLFNIVSGDLPDVINKYIKGELKPQKQDDSQATYTKHLTRQDGYIPPQTLAAALEGGIESVSLERKIRAFTPWPSVWTEIALQGLPLQMASQQHLQEYLLQKAAGQPKKKRLKILKAHTKQSTINNQQLTILALDLVQLEGKNPVTWKQFRDGYPHISL